MLINFLKKQFILILKSDSEMTEITIEDDGNGYPRDVLSKIGEPYLRSKILLKKQKQD